MTSSSTDRLLTIDQIAAKAGVSKRTIDRWKRNGKIRFYQPAGKGGAIRFPADALEESMDEPRNERQPAPKPVRRRSGPRPRWTKGPRS